MAQSTALWCTVASAPLAAAFVRPVLSVRPSPSLRGSQRLEAKASAIAIPFFGRKERSREELSDGIGNFYDRSSAIWERVWGEHMHHGYYPVASPAPRTLGDHRAAQSLMIDTVLDWAAAGQVDKPGKPAGRGATFWDGSPAPKAWRPRSVVDVGCGIGGSTRHIARRFAPGFERGVGVTLSPYQCARAKAKSAEAGLADKVDFQVANALALPLEPSSFDLVWSLESGEHMPDKPQFVSELCRVCAPGGRVIVVTWCHRDLREAEEGLTSREERLLDRINRAYYLPKWCSVADYKQLFEREGLVDIRTGDWTREISAFWPAVIKSSLTPRSLGGLLKSGLTTLRGALAMVLMIQGYRRGLIVFGLITGKKPDAKGGQEGN